MERNSSHHRMTAERKQNVNFLLPPIVSARVFRQMNVNESWQIDDTQYTKPSERVPDT